MTIAEVSKKCDITADTLRYYERIGLLPPVQRNSSGNRDYQETDINWINFIKCMRQAGMSIEALIEYVTMVQQGDDTSQARKELLLEQRVLIEERIKNMNETLQYLNQKIEHYDDLRTRCEDKLK